MKDGAAIIASKRSSYEMTPLLYPLLIIFSRYFRLAWCVSMSFDERKIIRVEVEHCSIEYSSGHVGL